MSNFRFTIHLDAVCKGEQEAKPSEFTRLAQLTLDRVTLFEDHIELDIKSGGMTSITKEFMKNEA